MKQNVNMIEASTKGGFYINKRAFGTRKLTKEEVKKLVTTHMLEHVALTNEDIANRFTKGTYKDGTCGKYSESNSNLSWFENVDAMVLYLKALLNTESVILAIKQWLDLWSPDQREYFKLDKCFSIPISYIVSRHSSWEPEEALKITKARLVLEVERIPNCGIFGFKVRTFYGIPTQDEYNALSKKIGADKEKKRQERKENNKR